MTAEVIGRALFAPGANSPEQLFELLRQRRCTVGTVPEDRWDKARYWHPSVGIRGKTYSFAAGIIDDCFTFDPAVFGMSNREAQLLDPQQRIVLMLTWKALEDANIDFADLRSQRVGVYIGASGLDHGNLIVEDPAAAGPYFMTGNTLSIVSNRVSHVFGLNGPSLTIDTACSSSMVALDSAMKALETGDVDTAIVGGVNVLTHPLAFVGFAQARMLSPEGLCRAYDNDGQGYVRAEGGAVIVLRRSDVAQAQGDRSHARILATGVNSAGRTNGISLPSRQAQANLLRSLYERNDIDPNRLAFIEGHGTGTKVGDPAEIWSIGTVVGAARRAPIPIGSIKTNIGHAEPASGLLGLMKAILSLEHNYFPASLHFETPNESVDFGALKVHVASEPIELLHGKHPRLAGVNSFGFGGTNAHIILSDPPAAPREREKAASGTVFMASAHTATALETLLDSYRKRLKEAPSADRKAIMAAAGANRPHMRHRFAVATRDASELVRILDQRARKGDGKDPWLGEALENQSKIAFVFSGNGAQWAGMAVDAYRGNSTFRDRFNVIHALFQVRAQLDLIDALFDPELDRRLLDTRVAQPILFATQAALSDVLGILGIRPDAVYGHSVGEVAAAYASGAISLVDAVSIVAKRSHHQHRLVGQGKMIAVQLSADQAMEFCRARGLNAVCVAAVNAETSVTLSGPVPEMLLLKEHLRSARVTAQLLDIDYPFHHPLIETAKEDFLADMAQIALRPSQVPFISTVTGAVLEGEALDPAYWWSNVREPVLFHKGTEAAIDAGCGLFVEIGPRPILSSYVRDTIKRRSANAAAIPSLVREDASGVDPVAQVFARIIAHGGAFDRVKIFGTRNSRIDLPALPMERVDLRHQFTSDAIDLYGRRQTPHTLAGWRVDLSSASWKNHIDAVLYPDLAEHVVDQNAILPGSAFMEIAVSAARQLFGVDAIEISNMDILRPLKLSEAHILEVSTILSPETGDVEIRSRERLSTDDWTIHAVARARPLSLARPSPETRARNKSATRVIQGAAAYETARRFGLDYGPRFRLLDQARLTSPRRIEVSLLSPAEAANPFVSYALHPVSVDAAFHGLVAVFDDISGERRGAPYIPVRFGCVRVYAPGEEIATATIDIRRISPTSVKVDLQFAASNGEIVATFEDCRFKRTYLRQPKSLDDVTLHQLLVPSITTVPVLARQGAANRKVSPRTVFPPPTEVESASVTQMLRAAVYRACHDIAMAASGGGDGCEATALPEEPTIRNFLVNCFVILEEVNLARQTQSGWVFEKQVSLPSVAAILGTVYRDRPDCIAEILAVNDVHQEALRRLGTVPTPAMAHGAAGNGSDQQPFMSDATLDHLRTHSTYSLPRLRMLRSAVLSLAGGNPVETSIRRIVEVCSVSRAFSVEMARAAEAVGADYVVVEPREAAFAELGLAFELMPKARVVRPADIGSVGAVDLAVSASDGLFRFLDKDAEFRHVLATALVATGRLLHCAPAPGAFADFIFGLDPDWFARTRALDFPVGQVASPDDWDDLLRSMHMRDGRVGVHDLAEGSVITIEALSPSADSEAAATGAIEATILLGHGIGDGLDFGAAILAVDLDRTGLPALRDVLATQDVRSVNVVYSPTRGETVDGADRLTAAVATVGRLAAVLHDMATATDDERPVRLAIVQRPRDAADLDGEASDTGLRTYLRVLRNEFPALEVHTIQFAGQPTAGEPALASHAARLLAAGSANREWSVDLEAGLVSEVRAVPGPVPGGRDYAKTYPAAAARQATPSQVSSLVWETAEPASPDRDEVVIDVKATGLNFRDVMWAMGMLPEEALEDGFAGATIGMECSGYVAAVGEDVTDFAVGEPVMAVAPAAFSTHVRVKQSGVTRLPGSVDVVAGATLPVAFITAYYAMVELANLREGETILIHGGAGGVGIAALQVAKARGATVIATAGTVEKRRFLRMLGADHVFNSRSLDFVTNVLNVTRQQGVDVVLNSLFGEAMERSLALVKPFGRFLELGKRDFFADTKLGLRPFRRNISYFGIDADQLLNAMPELSRRLLGEVSALFASGDLVPLPHRIFRHDEITSAFRLMQSSGHVGKIVVTPPVSGRDLVRNRAGSPVRFDPEGMHLVLGGIGGFGLAAANWMVERGARKIALCSRRGKADEATAAALERWAKLGVSATLHACDITDEAQLADLLGRLRDVAPLRGVLHAAMVLDDALISNLTEERIRPVVETKARAAFLLHRLTLQDALDHFILFSSATTLVGNPGQANYVAGNGYLEGLARSRRCRGLPALAVGFGAISDTGFLTRNAEVNDILAKRIGKTAMTSSQALEFVEEYMARETGTADEAVVVVAEIDWAAAKQLATIESPLFEVVARSAKAQAAGSDGDQIDLAAMVRGKSAEEGEQIIFQLVATEIAAILRVSVGEIHRSKVMKDVGLDSLMAMELGMNFRQKTGYDMPLSSITQSTTVGDVAQKLYLKVVQQKEAEPPPPAVAANLTVVDELAARHTATKAADLS